MVYAIIENAINGEMSKYADFDINIRRAILGNSPNHFSNTD